MKCVRDARHQNDVRFRRYGVFIIYFENNLDILLIKLMFLLWTLNIWLVCYELLSFLLVETISGQYSISVSPENVKKSLVFLSFQEVKKCNIGVKWVNMLTLSWLRPLSFCSTNQWTGFYMITASVMKELTSMWNLQVLRSLVDDFIYKGNED